MCQTPPWCWNQSDGIRTVEDRWEKPALPSARETMPLRIRSQARLAGCGVGKDACSCAEDDVQGVSCAARLSDMSSRLGRKRSRGRQKKSMNQSAALFLFASYLLLIRWQDEEQQAS